MAIVCLFVRSCLFSNRLPRTSQISMESTINYVNQICNLISWEYRSQLFISVFLISLYIKFREKKICIIRYRILADCFLRNRSNVGNNLVIYVRGHP